jgi:hypothetical protein
VVLNEGAAALLYSFPRSSEGCCRLPRTPRLITQRIPHPPSLVLTGNVANFPPPPPPPPPPISNGPELDERVGRMPKSSTVPWRGWGARENGEEGCDWEEGGGGKNDPPVVTIGELDESSGAQTLLPVSSAYSVGKLGEFGVVPMSWLRQTRRNGR